MSLGSSTVKQLVDGVRAVRHSGHRLLEPRQHANVSTGSVVAINVFDVEVQAGDESLDELLPCATCILDPACDVVPYEQRQAVELLRL